MTSENAMQIKSPWGTLATKIPTLIIMHWVASYFRTKKANKKKNIPRKIDVNPMISVNLSS